MDILLKSSVSSFKIKLHLGRLSFLPLLLLPPELTAQTWHRSAPHCLARWQEPTGRRKAVVQSSSDVYVQPPI